MDDFFDPKVPAISQEKVTTSAAAALHAEEETKAARSVVVANKTKLASALETKDAGDNAAAKSMKMTSNRNQLTNKPEKRIAVHCVAGLGRAPFLVALAIVYKGCKPNNAIKLIRSNRKAALNTIQANYILEMKPGKGIPKTGGSQGCACTIF